MKKGIPFVAVIILAAIFFVNKDEIKQMFNKGEDQAVNCSICVEECPCVETECVCKATCKCDNCVS
jgi:hypothetical protein